MPMKGFYLIFIFLLPSVAVFGQQEEGSLGIFEENSVVYRSQRNGGAILYTNGWGGNFYWGKHLDGFKRRMLGLELTTVKNPKEVRQYNPYHQNAKSYVFGKVNSVIALRPTYGIKVDKFDKLRENGVQVGYFFSAGPVLAFLKPVYLEIGKFIDEENVNPFDYDYLSAERYDPSEHSLTNIYGRSSYLKGLLETDLMVGLHVKMGAHFEYSPEKDQIRALEVGISGDFFPAPVPIMASDVNQSILFNIYINFLFGKKYKE